MTTRLTIQQAEAVLRLGGEVICDATFTPFGVTPDCDPYRRIVRDSDNAYLSYDREGNKKSRQVSFSLMVGRCRYENLRLP